MPAQFTTISTRPNFCLHLFGHRRDRVLLGYVANDRKRLPSGGFDELDGVPSVGEIGYRDMHAILGETFGKSLPDAVRASGDDGDLVLMPFAHEASPCFVVIQSERKSIRLRV